MKPIRLIVNWGIVILSPLWILPFLIYIAANENVRLRKETYFTGEKWLWE